MEKFEIEFQHGEAGVGPFLIVYAKNASEAKILAQVYRIEKGLDYSRDHIWSGDINVSKYASVLNKPEGME